MSHILLDVQLPPTGMVHVHGKIGHTGAMSDDLFQYIVIKLHMLPMDETFSHLVDRL